MISEQKEIVYLLIAIGTFLLAVIAYIIGSFLEYRRNRKTILKGRY